jgi:hypothetical protein
LTLFCRKNAWVSVLIVDADVYTEIVEEPLEIQQPPRVAKPE